ncbi:MAG: hypothetical protein JRJ84_20915 [Deltaproteobacteria bacterium]|nr:hypothetical protein [Deltaproteobacteria bacterium]
MLAVLAILAVASAADAVWDATPEHDAETVLVVVTPGFQLEGYLPLVWALRNDGRDVRVLTFGCGAQDGEALVEAIVTVAHPLGPDLTVVAHGVGAALVLMAAPRLESDRYVLLAPVLDIWPVASTEWLAGQPILPSLDLSDPLAWNDHPVQSLLLGEPVLPLTCVPVPFAAEVQGWIGDAHVPMDLSAVQAPVWIAVSAGDDVAAVEAVIPAARALPDRKLVRFGVVRLDRQDFTHGEMLRHAIPVRAAVRAAR